MFESTNIAKIGLLSACVFPFLLFFVGLVFVGTLIVCFFFGVRTGKETAEIWCVRKFAFYKKHEEGKNARRKSVFAMLEITMASSSGFLIL